MTQTSTTTESILWKDLIKIPEEQDTFVLKLTSGIADPQGTVDHYVVTDSLAERFDDALSLIADGLAVGRSGQPESQGAFLHGSFGSGKSHFMAVLSLLLDGYAPARDLAKLRDVVVDHEWMDDAKLLMVPYHMLGANGMEPAILGGYVDFIRKNHPDAPLPGVYVADKVLDNAKSLRDSMGDEAFFGAINKGGSSDSDGWGDYGKKTWDVETYEKALNAPPKDDLKVKLVGDVVDHLLPSLHDAAKVSQDGGFVGFDEGLSIISKHARDLGYDGLILFLDELILWLSRRAAEPDFVSREIQKVSKLVEAQHADRPAPIFSFVARQRDLSEMIGEEYTGEATTQLALQQESIRGRFKVIELEDRNLPAVAFERLLKPRDGDAGEVIRQAFDRKVGALTPTEREVMLTSQHDREDFELIFPFSPALMQALIVLSNELQRRRTALKIMQLLLMRNRDSLALGDLIPIGDLWEVLAEGDEPFDPVKKRLFRTAKDLDKLKLMPHLEREHGIDPDQLDPRDPGDARKLELFRDDARLLHTLLVSALVPHLEVFEQMTPQRLVALNHGVVQAPVPGAEIDQVMPKLRRWSTDFGEFHLTDPPNPTVELRLEGVDVEPLLEQANAQDNPGTRIQKIKKMLYTWFGLEEGRDLQATYEIEWRGDTRQAHVKYLNIRKQPLQRLESDGDHWMIVLDYPFDVEGFTPADDEIRLKEFRKQYPKGTDTIGWLPRFLSADGEMLLGRLVRTDAVLTQFEEYARDLRAEDRPVARRQLESNRDAIRDRLRLALYTAYGLGSDGADLLAESAAVNPLLSLAHNHEPKLPKGAEFAEALEKVVRDALAHKYSAAPKLPDERLRPKQVREMHEVMRAAIDSPENSVHVESHTVRRRLRNYAERLDLGAMGDNRFSSNRKWANKVQRELQPDDGPIDVGSVYELLDPPDDPTGLAKELMDLVVLSVADMEDMVVQRRGEPIDPSAGELRGYDELVRRTMPSDNTWDEVRQVASTVFDVRPPQMLNARSVQKLAADLGSAATTNRAEALQIQEKLVQAGRHLGLSRDEVEATRRYQIAHAMRELLMAFDEHDDATDLMEAIVAVGLSDDRAAVGQSFRNAPANLAVLEQIQWQLFDHLVDQGEQCSPGAQGLLEEARELLGQAEHAARLSELENIQARLIKLMTTPPPSKPGGDDGDDERDGEQMVAVGSMRVRGSEASEAVQKWLAEHLENRGDDEVEITIRLGEVE